ncbi:RES family NAD+ phosphorylase [Leptothoe sp. LEGE 181152]|nr:RES family NAD+ phosphorylase [Leptothoe sp. LEGE 181152]
MPDSNHRDPRYIADESIHSLKLVRIYTHGKGRGPTVFNYSKNLRGRFDHHISNNDESDEKRGIYYAAASFSPSSIELLHCCLAERFQGIANIPQEIEYYATQKHTPLRVAFCKPLKSMKIIDLRGDGPLNWNVPKDIILTSNRKLSQKWSRYLYENTDADGILYPSFRMRNHLSARGLETNLSVFNSIALYERAKKRLDLRKDDLLSNYLADINEFIVKYLL